MTDSSIKMQQRYVIKYNAQNHSWMYGIGLRSRAARRLVLIFPLSKACLNAGETLNAELLTLPSCSTRSIVSGDGLLHSFSTAVTTLSIRCSASSSFALQCKGPYWDDLLGNFSPYMHEGKDITFGWSPLSASVCNSTQFIGAPKSRKSSHIAVQL